jgi:predicted GNAT family acetyltransferase
VQLQSLSAADDDATLALFLTVQRQGFGLADGPLEPATEEVAQLRRDLRAGHLHCALARFEATAAGAGSTTRVEDIAELVGVSTRPELRRRGVAATVSSRLVRDHFNRGGTLAWLSAADSIAEAVYRRIGFRTIASRLNYIDNVS